MSLMRKRKSESAQRSIQKAKRSKQAAFIPRAPSMPGIYRSNKSEVKALDVATAVYALNTTGSVIPLNLIVAGSSFFNRVGRKLEMTSLRVTGQIFNINTSVTNCYSRIALVYDRQTNGANPAIADMFQTTTFQGTNVTTSLSGVNLNNRDRFVILRDKRFVSPSQTYTAGVETNVGVVDPVTTSTNIDLYVKLKGLVVQYKADSAPTPVIGDIATGAIFLVTFSNLAAGVEGWAANLESRLRFHDL